MSRDLHSGKFELNCKPIIISTRIRCLDGRVNGKDPNSGGRILPHMNTIQEGIGGFVSWPFSWFFSSVWSHKGSWGSYVESGELQFNLHAERSPMNVLLYFIKLTSRTRGMHLSREVWTRLNIFIETGCYHISILFFSISMIGWACCTEHWKKHKFCRASFGWLSQSHQSSTCQAEYTRSELLKDRELQYS